jgi:CRISPR/Cas system-associated exonuclease Cas4 (RecB family)
MTTPDPSKPASPLINASELGEFAYCERAWWLRHARQLSPVPTERLASGRAAHQKHFDAVQSATRWRWLAVGLVAVALLLLLLVIGLGLS